MPANDDWAEFVADIDDVQPTEQVIVIDDEDVLTPGSIAFAAATAAAAPLLEQFMEVGSGSEKEDDD